MKNRTRIFALWVTLALLISTFAVASAAPMSGAIFTTNEACGGTNVNIFTGKADVYLDGGPAGQGGAAGLPDGSYYVQVTDPDGDVLGKTSTASVTVSAGEFAECYQLAEILYTASSDFADKGFDDTSNPGGVYKVWASKIASFPPSESKTDNFKVKAAGDGDPPTATLRVVKFYDANANGANDDELEITGWKVNIKNGIDVDRYTPVEIILDPDDYIVSEFDPLQTNWLATTPKSVDVTLADGDDETVEFGNLCLGEGGGSTIGFWGNKNGEALFGTDDLAALVALNLRNEDGTHFDPASYAAFKEWLRKAKADNMAYMLSAQLAAMKLNVLNGKVAGNALIYAPGTTSANALGFATVNAVMDEANAALGENGETKSGHAARSYQEALKNALDRANNNTSFVQSSPCAFSFDEEAN